jgi:outer membrane protein TolC
MGEHRVTAGGSLWRGLAALAMAGALMAAPDEARAQVSLTTVVELAQRNSAAVRLAEADVAKAAAQLAESHDVFIPALNFGSGLPAFAEIGFTGSLPTLWDANVQSMAFSMPMIREAQAARLGLKAAELSLKDTREQVALDASTAYIELDAVNRELAAARQQEADAGRLVEIEQKRTDAGVDPLISLLQTQLTAEQLKLNRLHLETRAATLSKQIAVMTNMPTGSITPDRASIPAIPAITGDEAQRATPGLESAEMQARSKAHVALGDQERRWWPQIGFGILYNRNTTLLNNVNNYFATAKDNGHLPANNLSSGFSIQLPIFNLGYKSAARASAADALRARVEAEQAQQQNDVQVAELNGELRELDAQAEIARLKEEIASEQLKGVQAQLESGNGAGAGPNAQPQLSPTAEQQAMIDERQRYEDALEAGLNLAKARLDLLRALGHMQDWLNELHTP